MNTALLSLVLGAVIGLSLGLLGGGGSILTVPALVYLIGIPVAEATGTSLAIVGATALVGALRHQRAGRVALRAALGFGAASVLGAIAGSLLGKHIAGGLLLVLFALLMLVAAGVMLRPRRSPTAGRERPVSAGPLKVAAAGLAVGLLTGFFGVGGGFVIVPALTLVLGLPMATAIGTSLVVIALASAAGFLTHLGAGALNVPVTLFFLLGGVVGSLTGAQWAGRLPESTLRRSFALLVVALAGYLLVRNHAAVGVLA